MRRQSVFFNPSAARATFYPLVTNTYDLGTATKVFRSAYFGTSLIFTASNFYIIPDTVDGSDTKTLVIGNVDYTRGAWAQFTGNETGGAGRVDIQTGNASGANMNLLVRSSNGAITFGSNSVESWRINSSGQIIQNGTNGGIIGIGRDGYGVYANTSDGADNLSVVVAGGGANAATRGAWLQLYGNEHASVGAVVLSTGSGAGHLDLKLNNASSLLRVTGTGGGNRWYFDDAGRFVQDGTSGSDIVLNNSDAIIRQGTSDTTDNKSITVAGGGGTSNTRGGKISVYGNEYASVGGAVTIVGGGVTTGAITLQTQSSSADINFQTAGNNRWGLTGGSGHFWQDTSTGGDIVFNVTSGLIRQGTSDASDNKSLTVAGGGASGSSRGGQIELYGNENANTGKVILRAGNIAGGTILFATGGVDRWSVLANGDLYSDGSNGGGIFLPRGATTPLVTGLASVVGDISGGPGSPNILAFSSTGATTQAIFAKGTNDTAGAYCSFLKSRGTDGNADVIVVSGDEIGAILAYGADGASYRQAASVVFRVDGTPGVADMPGRIEFRTSPDGSATPATRWTIDSAGVLKGDATNGLGILLPKTGANVTPIDIGLSSVDADLTALTSTHYGLLINQNRTISDSIVCVANAADTLAGVITFAKTRSASPATDANTVVVNGDELGVIRFLGADGASYRQAAMIAAKVDGTPGASDMPGRLEFYTTPDGSTSAARRWYITSAGHLQSDATSGGGLIFSTSNPYISGTSGDGSDNQELWINPTGQTFGTTNRGAGIRISGNESSNLGSVLVHTGNTTYCTFDNKLGGSQSKYRITDNSDVLKFAVSADNKIEIDKTITAGGTTGAQTINKAMGTVNFAAAATSLVVTNNTVSTSSIVLCTIRTNDSTAVIKNVVPAAGSFTINLNAAATAETSVGFLVLN